MSPAQTPESLRQRINPWRMFHGALVPNWLLRRNEVSAGAKLCYARLAQFAGKNNNCHPRQETLATELAVSTRTVGDYLRELRHHGLLEWERRGQGKANRYFFLDHPWIHAGPALRTGSDSTSQKTSGQQRQLSSTPIKEENQGRESKERGTQKSASPACPLPSSEEEAVKAAASVGVPADFAREVFNHMEGVGWVDGTGRVICKWESYIKSRWSREQSERAQLQLHHSRKHRSISTSSVQTVRPGTFTNAIGKL